jgi:hypothetical protein
MRCCARAPAFRLSQTDPPQHLRAAAQACRNEGAPAVLVDEQDRTVLSAAIILEDHPGSRPRAGATCSTAAKIDQMLVLNIMS